MSQGNKKGILIGAVCAGAVLLGGGGWAIGNFVILPEMRYKDAIALYEEDEFQKAKSAFEDMDGYKDAEAMILACDYGRAEAYFDDEKYEKAQKLFDKLGDYEDAQERSLECRYAFAEQQLEEGSHYEALEAFKALRDYEDAAERVKECSYEIAKRLYDSGLYEEATVYLVDAYDYEGATDLFYLCKYDLGNTLMNDGDYTGAKDAFLSIKHYENAEELAEYCDNMISYENAFSLYEQGNYQEAAEKFEALGDFDDAEKKTEQCYFFHAIALYDEEQYEEALEIFESLGDYDKAKEYAEYCIEALNEESIEEPVSAEAGQAYLAISDDQYWVQYWGDAEDGKSYMLAYGAEVAAINGNGSYTVSVTTDTNGFRLDTTGDMNGEYAPEGLGFCALIIKDGSTLFPGAVITIDSIVIDGKEIEMTAQNYTSSDDGVELRSNIYNPWMTGISEDAYSSEGEIYGSSVEADYSAQIIDADQIPTWEIVEVNFTISGLE